MKQYTIMGAHPGDGSVQLAENALEAFAKHIILDYDEDMTIKQMIKEIQKDIDAGYYDVITEGNCTCYGDYEVKEIEG